MGRVLGGALLVIAGIAAFIEGHTHPFVPGEGFRAGWPLWHMYRSWGR
jgi:hypothetical protein